MADRNNSSIAMDPPCSILIVSRVHPLRLEVECTMRQSEPDAGETSPAKYQKWVTPKQFLFKWKRSWVVLGSGILLFSGFTVLLYPGRGPEGCSLSLTFVGFTNRPITPPPGARPISGWFTEAILSTKNTSAV